MTDDYMREKCFNYRPLNMTTLPIFKVKAPANYLTTRSNGYVTAPMPPVPPRNIDDLAKRLAQTRRMNELQGIEASFQSMIKKKVEEEAKKNFNTDSIFQKRRQSNNNFSKQFQAAEEKSEDIMEGEERMGLDDDIDPDVEIEIEDEKDMSSLKTPSTTSDNFIEDMNGDFGGSLNKMFNPRKERSDKGLPHDYPMKRKSRLRTGDKMDGEL